MHTRERRKKGIPMTYKGILLATAGSVIGMSGAQAADLPMKAAPMYTPAPATWTGLYGGIHLGANWQLTSARYGVLDDPYGPTDAALGKAHGAGFIGGGQIGYNWQMGTTVWGLEATISGLTGKATTLDEFYTGIGYGNQVETKIDWLATFRGRLGWLMNPDTLLYATGGLAVGGVKNAANVEGLLYETAHYTVGVNKTKTGYVVGGGMEHMLNRNWTVALEGLYVDLGKSSGISADGSKTGSFKNSAVIGQLKVNYKF
jgi:outer membrane immunogenic protein